MSMDEALIASHQSRLAEARKWAQETFPDPHDYHVAVEAIERVCAEQVEHSEEQELEITKLEMLVRSLVSIWKAEARKNKPPQPSSLLDLWWLFGTRLTKHKPDHPGIKSRLVLVVDLGVRMMCTKCGKEHDRIHDLCPDCAVGPPLA